MSTIYGVKKLALGNDDEMRYYLEPDDTFTELYLRCKHMEMKITCSVIFHMLKDTMEEAEKDFYINGEFWDWDDAYYTFIGKIGREVYDAIPDDCVVLKNDIIDFSKCIADDLISAGIYKVEPILSWYNKFPEHKTA